MNKILVEYNQKHLLNYWKGHQLIAGDGSTIALPAARQMKAHFGIYSSTKGGVKSCMAQVFMLYDVLSDIVIDGRLSKIEDGEKTLLKECLKELPVSKSIFILDRGFGYFGVCKRFIEQQRDFCIRISTSNAAFGKLAMENPLPDFLTDWEPSEAERATSYKQGQDLAPIRVRVTKIMLPKGETELLVSSLLDRKIFNISDLKELYRLRWGIEEGFKKLKPKMKLEHFGSRKPEGIFQEFQTHLFMMNMVAILGNAAQIRIEKESINRKLKYKYNWQNAFRFVREQIVKLVSNIDIEQLIEGLLVLISRSAVAIRQNRQFPRIRVRKRKPRAHPTYK